MDFTIDSGQGDTKLANPSWRHVEDSLRQINRDTCCFFILTADNGSYLQCAGGRLAVTLEFREVLTGKFKHFILGKRQVASALKTTWSVIDCRIGPIRVHKDEVFSLEEAIEAFELFFRTGHVGTSLTKRNVTKHFHV